MESFKDIHELSPEIMEAYLSGDLNDAQRHQVEKLLLEDDFAAEAMEGMSMLNAEERSKSLHKLQGAIGRHSNPRKKTVSIPWYAAAAVILLLLTAGYFLWQNRATGPSSSPLAENQGEEFPSTDSTLAYAQEKTESEIAKTEKSGVVEEETTIARLNSEPANTSADTVERIALAAETDEEYEDSMAIILGDVSPERLSQIDAATLDTMAIQTTLPRPAAELDKTQATSGRIAGEPIKPELKTMSGRVVLQDGTPIANVNVKIDGQGGLATMSDDQGNFEITGNSDTRLVFTLMGLKPKSVDGSSLGESGQIVMDQEALTLSELEISSPSAEQSTTRGARPEVSEDAFRLYLMKSAVHPNPNDKQSGEVMIRVTIEPDGTISNTKIIRSLSEAYDVEAIRLIREGPAWQPALRRGEAVEDKVRVKVMFRGD